MSEQNNILKELVNRQVKVVWKDGDIEKVVRGIFKGFDDFTLSILDKENNIIVVGKPTLISLIEVEGKDESLDEKKF